MRPFCAPAFNDGPCLHAYVHERFVLFLVLHVPTAGYLSASCRQLSMLRFRLHHALGCLPSGFVDPAYDETMLAFVVRLSRPTCLEPGCVPKTMQSWTSASAPADCMCEDA